MWSAIKWILLYFVVQFLLILSFSFYYVNSGYDINFLSSYISDIQIYLVVILGLIFIPLLLFKYKKFKIKEKKISKFYLYICFVYLLSVSYNILAYYFDKHVLLSGLYGNDINIFVSIVSTVLIGPIIEELLFRGIIYNNLKEKYDIKKSMFITTVLFSLCHFTFVQIVYTLIFGYLLVYIYEKYQNIKYPIILHMVSNLVTTLISLFVIKDYLIINIILFLVSITFMYFIYRRVNND